MTSCASGGGDVHDERIYTALAALTTGPEPATALVTGNASTTVATIRLLGADFGTRAIVGFDDFPLADLLRPGLSLRDDGQARIGASVIGMRLVGGSQ